MKGCSNAVIELSSANYFKRPYYGLNLGADQNKVSKLYKVSDSATSERIAFQSVLDCLQFKTFWIEWDIEVVRVGRGNDVGKGVFITSIIDNCPIIVNSVWISSIPSEVVSWKFLYISGIQNTYIYIYIIIFYIFCWGFSWNDY